MAPQNSTLIDENLDVCSSILNIPEEINRYSPILPPKKKENLNKNMNNNNINNNNYKNNINNNNHVNQDQTKFIQKWEQTEMEQRHCLKYKRQRGTGNNRSGQSRRSRSISLYGVNSTMEQGHKEITIWLGDEPRYVSGVTNKTTCNDIIKALIDDEISNGNYEYCQRLKDGTASRDYSDYVITECWRGIERSYDGIMPILPVWKAWSRVQNEIRLSLKHHKDIQDPSKAFKTNITLSSIRNYICKLLSFGKNKQRKTKSNKSNKPKFNGQCNNNKKETPSKSEEIMMVLMPDMKYGKENSDPSTSAATEVKNSNLKPSTDESKLQAKTKINKEKLYKLSETRSSIRKRRSTCRRKEKKNTHDKRPDSNGDVNNFLRKRKDSSIRSSLRNKLAQKNVEMNELYDREYALTRELTNKCKMYKIQNELYTTSDKNLEMSVGQIQRSIEECAKEIIQTEHELLEVKNVIKHDISIINNLKRLTLDTDPNECGVPIDIEKALKAQPEIEIEPTPTTTDVAAEKMQFVDNIYEFCDNNASVLV